MKEIRNLMRNLSDLHYKFVKTDYELTALDISTVKNLIEELNLQILLSNNTAPQSEKVFVKQHVTPKIQPTVFTEKINEQEKEKVAIVKKEEVKVEEKSEEITVQDLNQEMEEIFFPEPIVSEVHIEEIQPNRPTFQLGINERIMFAREIFNNDVSELQQSIRHLQSFQKKEEAQTYFEKQFYPSMINQGKDEEILKEFEQIIERLY